MEGNHTSNTNNNCSNYILGLCPRHWVLSLHGECFKVYANRLDWNSAKSACEALGSNLAVLNSKAKLRDFSASAAAGKADDLWIGLHRNPTHKPSWIWVGGLRVTFATWDTWQPSNYQAGEDCGVLKKLTKKWHDYPCTARFGYICEINGKCNLHDKKEVEN